MKLAFVFKGIYTIILSIALCWVLIRFRTASDPHLVWNCAIGVATFGPALVFTLIFPLAVKVSNEHAIGSGLALWDAVLAGAIYGSFVTHGQHRIALFVFAIVLTFVGLWSVGRIGSMKGKLLLILSSSVELSAIFAIAWTRLPFYSLLAGILLLFGASALWAFPGRFERPEYVLSF